LSKGRVELLASPPPGDRGANPNFPPPPLLPFTFPSSLPEAAVGQSRAASVKGAAGSWCLPARRFWREAPYWSPVVVPGARLARRCGCWHAGAGGTNCVWCTSGMHAGALMGSCGPRWAWAGLAPWSPWRGSSSVPARRLPPPPLLRRSPHRLCPAPSLQRAAVLGR
jgi:hypothetical protein